MPAKAESTVELGEWDAGVQETVHKVIVVHVDLLRGLLDAIVSATLCRNKCRTGPTTEPKRRKRKEEKGAHVCTKLIYTS